MFVNKDLKIIDGQHRLAAIKELGQPVIYCILKDYSLSQVTRYNINNKNWNDDNYVKMYCDLDYREYIIYKRFKEQFGLGHSICRVLLCGLQNRRGSKNDDFKNGLLKITTLSEGTKIADFIRALDYKHSKAMNFVAALANFEKKNIKYDRNRMKLVIESSAYKLNGYVRATKDYIKIISELYNYHLPEDSRVQFYDSRDFT